MKLNRRAGREDGDDRVEVHLCPKCGGDNIDPPGAADGMLVKYYCKDRGYDGRVVVQRTAVIHEDETVDVI